MGLFKNPSYTHGNIGFDLSDPPGIISNQKVLNFGMWGLLGHRGPPARNEQNPPNGRDTTWQPVWQQSEEPTAEDDVASLHASAVSGVSNVVRLPGRQVTVVTWRHPVYAIDVALWIIEDVTSSAWVVARMIMHDLALQEWLPFLY